MPRKTDTRERMIRAAKDGFRTNGMTATGFSEILERSGAARGAIYHHFPGGKEELTVAVLRSSAEDVVDLIRSTLDAHDGNTCSAIEAFFDLCIAALDGSGGRSGCPITPAVLESPDAPMILEAADEAFRAWQSEIASHLRGDGWGDADATDLAATVIAAVEGAFVLGRATRTSEPMKSVRNGIHRLLRQLQTEPRGGGSWVSTPATGSRRVMQ